MIWMLPNQFLTIKNKFKATRSLVDHDLIPNDSTSNLGT